MSCSSLFFKTTLSFDLDMPLINFSCPPADSSQSLNLYNKNFEILCEKNQKFQHREPKKIGKGGGVGGVGEGGFSCIFQSCGSKRFFCVWGVLTRLVALPKSHNNFRFCSNFGLRYSCYQCVLRKCCFS